MTQYAMKGTRYSYPFLVDGSELHISPRGATVFNPGHPKLIYISRCTAEILAHMEGTATLDDILGRFYRIPNVDNFTLIEATACLAELSDSGLIGFSATPMLLPPQVKGSFEIFYPENIQVEITTACNLRCTYCYRDAQHNDGGRRLSTDKLLSILTVLRERGLNSVELTGGEPFLHPDFDRIAEFCGATFSLVGLLTNGVMITERNLRPLLAYKHKFVVSVSLDSHIPEVHDRRRGCPGAFERTLEGIKLLASSGFLTRVSMSVDENNWPHIEETLLLAKSIGAFAFAYSPILPFGRGKRDFKLWLEPAQKIIEAEKELHRKYRGFLDLLSESTILAINEPGSCGAGHRVYAMDPNGYIRPCVTFGTSEAVFGCLATESPEEVFGGKLSQRFADLKAPDRKTCGDCRWSLFCRNCVYRGLVASAWEGEKNCRWLRNLRPNLWYEEVRAHSQSVLPDAPESALNESNRGRIPEPGKDRIFGAVRPS